MLLGCGSEQGAAESNTATASVAPTQAVTASATAVATAVSASASVGSGPPAKPLSSNAIPIDNLRIAIEPPGATTGSVHDMGEQMSILRFAGYPIQITIGPAHGDLAHMKQKREKEDGFVRWAAETADSAIAELLVENKKEYYGFTIRTVRGVSVECGTLTMKRRSAPSEKDVKSALALCDGLR